MYFHGNAEEQKTSFRHFVFFFGLFNKRNKSTAFCSMCSDMNATSIPLGNSSICLRVQNECVLAVTGSEDKQAWTQAPKRAQARVQLHSLLCNVIVFVCFCVLVSFVRLYVSVTTIKFVNSDNTMANNECQPNRLQQQQQTSTAINLIDQN